MRGVRVRGAPQSSPTLTKKRSFQRMKMYGHSRNRPQLRTARAQGLLSTPTRFWRPRQSLCGETFTKSSASLLPHAGQARAARVLPDAAHQHKLDPRKLDHRVPRRPGPGGAGAHCPLAHRPWPRCACRLNLQKPWNLDQCRRSSCRLRGPAGPRVCQHRWATTGKIAWLPPSSGTVLELLLPSGLVAATSWHLVRVLSSRAAHLAWLYDKTKHVPHACRAAHAESLQSPPAAPAHNRLRRHGWEPRITNMECAKR